MADRTRYTGNLTSDTNLYVDVSTDRVGIGTTIPTSKLSVTGNVSVSGVITAISGYNLGISSNGTSITTGPITNINFVGTGNTFNISGTTANVTINKTLTVGTRTTAAVINLVGVAFTISLRTGVGTVTI